MSGNIKPMMENTEIKPIHISAVKFFSAVKLKTLAAKRVGDIFIAIIIVVSIWLGRML